MNELTLEKEITKLEKYLKRELREDFIERMRNSGPQEREEELLKLAKYAQEIQNTMNSDEELDLAKRKVSELRYPYQRDKNMNKKLTRFVHLLMKEDGQD